VPFGVKDTGSPRWLLQSRCTSLNAGGGVSALPAQSANRALQPVRHLPRARQRLRLQIDGQGSRGLGLG